MRSFVAKSVKLFSTCVALSLSVSLLIAFVPINVNEECPKIAATRVKFQNEHRLAIIVPFRDRFDELLKFVPHLSAFVSAQNISHDIYIVNQSDNLRFNRASLINAGYLVVNRHCDYIAMHDVDLLPLNPQLSYAFPSNGPFHLSSPDIHPKYHYKTFVGGILLITNEHFELVNGMSNRYWGWGLEDDEFYARLKQAKLNVGDHICTVLHSQFVFQISRPHGLSTGSNDTFVHLHDTFPRKRDTAKLYNQREVTRKRDRETGLHDVDFELISRQSVTIDGSECNVLNVRLKCDLKLTPWCRHKPVAKSKKS